MNLNKIKDNLIMVLFSWFGKTKFIKNNIIKFQKKIIIFFWVQIWFFFINFLFLLNLNVCCFFSSLEVKTGLFFLILIFLFFIKIIFKFVLNFIFNIFFFILYFLKNLIQFRYRLRLIRRTSMSFWSKEVDWVSFFDTLVFIFHGGFITLRYFLKTPEFYFSFRDVRVHVRNLEEVLQTNTAFRNNINEVSLETDYTTFYEKKVIFGINNYFYYRLFFFLRYRIIFPFVYGILWLYFKLTLFDMQLLFSNKLFFLECLVVKYVNDFLSLNSRDLSIFRFFRSYVFNYIYLIFKLIQWHLAFWGLIFSFKTLKFYLNLLFSLLKSLFNFLIYSLFTFFTKFQFKHAYKYQFSVQYICFDLQKKKFYNFFSNELFFQNYIYLFYFFFLRKSVFYIKKLDKRIRLLRKYISLNKKLKNKLKPIFKKNFTSFFLIKKKIDYYKKKK